MKLLKILVLLFLIPLFGCGPAPGTVVFKIRQLNDAKINIYDVNQDGVLDIIASGYQSGKKVNDDLIQVGDGVVLIDGNTKKFVWKYITGDEVRSYPAIEYNKVFFGSMDKKIYALNLQTGKLEWFCKTGGPVISSPTVYKEKVYIGSSDGNFYCIDAQTGVILWKYYVYWPINSSPAASNNTVYFGALNKYVYALDYETGEVKWKTKIGGFIGEIGLAVTRDKLFVGSWDGALYCLNTNTGEILWDYPTDDILQHSSPAIYGNTVYFGSYDGVFYVLNVNDGSLKWKFRAKDAIYGSPVVSSSAVYFTSRDGHIYSLSQKGRIRWKLNTKLKIKSSPAIGDNMVYFGMPGGWFDKVLLGPEGKPNKGPHIVYMGSYIYGISDNEMGNVKWAVRGGDPSHRASSSYAIRFANKINSTANTLDNLLKFIGINFEEKE